MMDDDNSPGLGGWIAIAFFIYCVYATLTQ